MRIFTKSLLALALLLVASGVNAQKAWQKIATQGWCHEYRDGSDQQTDAAALTDADGAYVVHALSQDQMNEIKAGVEGYSFQSWDSQFFITWDEADALMEGDKIKVTMKVRADAEPSASVGTQAHANPGNYNYWTGIGNVTFTTEWATYESGEVEVTKNMAVGEGGDKPGFYSIAFNLALGEENTFYFKDIVVEVYADKKTTKTVVSTKYDWNVLISNGDAEGDDLSNFPVSWDGPNNGGTANEKPEIVAGEGVNGSKCFKVVSFEEPTETWHTQFYVYSNEMLPKGTKWQMKMSVKADREATISTSAQAAPRTWKGGMGIDNFNVNEDWQDFTWNGSISVDDFQSVAFDLNNDGGSPGLGGASFFFDNIEFKKGVLINSVTHQPDAIQILFTDWTNIPDLIKAATIKSRLVLPDDIANQTISVVADGVKKPISTVEYDKAGQLFVFLDEEIADNAKDVKVTFTNPADEAYHIVFTNGDNIGQAVEDFEAASTFDEELDLVPFAFGKPDLEATDPENGSFNLPATISEFKVTFDKAVQCKLIEAKLDEKEKLTVSYEKDDAEEITLKRAAGAAALADGAHTITISRVYANTDQSLTEVSSFTVKFSVGAPAMHDDLTYALEKAKAELDESTDDQNRYAGDAYNALKAAIEQYEAEGVNYTAPSVVKAAVNDLSLKTENMKLHRQNCNDYDQSLASAIELVGEYGESKFAKAELYQTLKEAVGKYEGKVLYDDEELEAAVADLKNNVAAGQQMFTEGESKNGDAGIKVLVDRIRQGAEALQALGVSDEDELIVAAGNVLTDDDALADAIKNRLMLEVYGKLKDGDESIFTSEMNDETGEEIAGGPNFTVFVKNPNMYALYPANGINLENTPGWERLNGNMGLYGSGGANWGTPRNIEGLPEDCAFTIYQADTRAEQTITDLPAGNYLVTLYGCDWANKKGDDGTGPDAEGFVYVKTSDTPAVEEGAEEDRDVNFAATCTAWYPGQYRMDGAHNMEVTVTDGKLTIGMQFKSDSQYFFGDVKLTLIGKADGFDYAAAYDKITNEIEAIKQNVNHNVIFDLQGRRIANPSKGLYIKNNKKVVIK